MGIIYAFRTCPDLQVVFPRGGGGLDYTLWGWTFAG